MSPVEILGIFVVFGREAGPERIGWTAIFKKGKRLKRAATSRLLRYESDYMTTRATPEEYVKMYSKNVIYHGM